MQVTNVSKLSNPMPSFQMLSVLIPEINKNINYAIVGALSSDFLHEKFVFPSHLCIVFTLCLSSEALTTSRRC